MNNAINYQISKRNLNILEVNIAEVLLKAQKRQNSRFAKLFHPVRFEEEYEWLNIYG